MPKIDAEIINKLGLHARASAKLTQMAGRFKAEIWIARSGRRVNAKSIMGVMMLAAGMGTTVSLEAEGDDADAGARGATGLIAEQVRRRRVAAMNFVLHGAAVSSGVTIGHAHLVSRRGWRWPTTRSPRTR